MLEKDGILLEPRHDNTKREFSDIFPNDKVDITVTEFQEILRAIRENEDWNNEFDTYLKMRWFKNVLHWQNMANRHYYYYFAFSTIALIASAITTALSGINVSNAYLNTSTRETIILGISSVEITEMILISSLIVTISVGMIKLFKFQEVRQRKTQYAELIRIEGFRFLQLTGDHYRTKSYKMAFPIFSDILENILREGIEGYIKLFDGSGNKNENEIRNNKDN